MTSLSRRGAPAICRSMLTMIPLPYLIKDTQAVLKVA